MLMGFQRGAGPGIFVLEALQLCAVSVTSHRIAFGTGALLLPRSQETLAGMKKTLILGANR